MTSIVFLDWRPHNRRAESLAHDLDAKLCLAPPVLRKRLLAPIRYTLLSLRTLNVLWRLQPDIVIASSPPSFLPIIVSAYAWLSGCRYVVDAHHLATTGIWSWIPFGSSYNRHIMRQAKVTIVHNEMIETLARAEGIPAITLETKIPELDARPSSGFHAERFQVLVPCSFDSDEPIPAIFEAAALLPEVKFYLTGDSGRLSGRLRNTVPGNVTLTGFLTPDAYDRLLAECGAILALTDTGYPVRPRAASEALAAEKPLVTSRNPATESHVGWGAILIENTGAEIARAITAVRENYDHYRKAIAEVKRVRNERYAMELQRLKELLM